MISRTDAGGGNNVFPTEFNIFSMVLYSFASQKYTDIRLITSELNIYENLFENTISGDVLINDANNLIANMPIYGHELLIIKFNAPNNDELKFEKTFRVYKVANREPVNDRYHYYHLFFSSIADIENEGTMISKSYTNTTPSSIADDIIKNSLSEKFFFLEETKNKFDFVFPNVDPLTALEFLASRSVGISRNMGSHIFFENRDGYHFRSLESLLEISPVARINYDPKNVRYFDSPSDLDFDKEFRSTQMFVFKTTIDVMNNVHNGMYVNTVYGHDILHKIVRTYAFDYTEEYEKSLHLEDGVKKKLGGSEFSPNDEVNSVFTYVPFESVNKSTEVERTKDLKLNSPVGSATTQVVKGRVLTFSSGVSESFPADTGTSPRRAKKARKSVLDVLQTPEDLREIQSKYVKEGSLYESSSETELFSLEKWEEFSAQRNSILHSLQENVVISLALPGSIDYTVGAIIEFFPPSNEQINEDSEFKEDKLLSGKYLITNVRHKIGQNAFFTFLEITKDCFYTDTPL